MRTNETDVLHDVQRKLGTGEASKTSLQTDRRVIARITDGIYRSPSSALRELVANAYDADAELVTIETNPPWFDQIVVRDDGEGMDEVALVRLINHIGGSSKRTRVGVELGTTSQDPQYSPGGRRLIGRIGIGLFSVSQMTRHFQIVTKRRGNRHRFVADVVLDVYHEEEDASSESIATGVVNIQSFQTDDTDSHGTDIILLDLKRDARALLTSSIDRENQRTFTYHIGIADNAQPSSYVETPNLPWTPQDEPLEKFAKLIDSVRSITSHKKVTLEEVLDRYLQIMWRLSLAVPLDYVGDKHPFDLDSTAGLKVFRLSNVKGGAATPLDFLPGQTIRSLLDLKAPEKGPRRFRVVMDGVELRRPLRFDDAANNHGDTPLLFVGSWEAPIDTIPVETSGGRELVLEGYFLWRPKISPAEHAGVLIRIADASGILFDDRFMEYQVAELTRLRQTSAELFLHRGFDAALNIDRESYNSAHPHAKLVRHWVHSALRQLATRQKQIAEANRDVERERQRLRDNAEVESVIIEKQDEMRLAIPDDVEIIVDSPVEIESKRRCGIVAYDAKRLVRKLKSPNGSAKVARKEGEDRLKKIEAIARLLSAFRVFDTLSFEHQQELLNGIARIVWGSTNE